MRPSLASISRLAGVAALAAFLAPAPRAPAAAAFFLPLHHPPTGEHHPGKVVWADLFTTDVATVTLFYCELFGWKAASFEQNGRTYTVFSNAGQPVAGLVLRRKRSGPVPSRWIVYLAVTNIGSTLARVTGAGGQVHAPARDFPDRGFQAIIADNEGSPIGLLRSSTGDSSEDEPRPGAWSWCELYANDPKSASAFYGRVFNYAVTPDNRTTRQGDYLLASGGVPRAGVAPRPDRQGAAPGWLGVIRVANIDETVERASALGGDVLVAPRSAANGSRFAVIADSTGGTVGLVEYVDNGNPATRP